MGFNNINDPSDGEILIPPNVQYVIGIDELVIVHLPAGSNPTATWTELTNTLTMYMALSDVSNPEEVLIVGENIDDVVTVANNIDDVIIVATNIGDLVIIVANLTNINIVAANDANITIVADINADITTLAGIEANIVTVAGISSDVTTVAGISTDVTAVAAIESDVTIAAANVADITNFADVYQGGKASDPATRNDSSALQTGDMYFNTTDDEMKVYTTTLTWIGTVTPSTDTPTKTGNTTGTETTILVVTVTNWNAVQTLTISVEEGSYIDNEDGTISWTLPVYTGGDDSHNMSIQATEPSHVISEIATHTVTVLEAVGGTDQTILFENGTMTATEFPATGNIDLSGNTILADADVASATSYKVEQDGGDTDFINATPTVDNTAINYTVSAGATTSNVTITGAATFVTGDILLMNKTETTALDEIDTTSITTDNGGDSYTFDISGLSFTNAPLIVAKDTAHVTTSLVSTGLSDDFETRTVQSHTADKNGALTDIISSTDPFGGGELLSKYPLDANGTDIVSAVNGTVTGGSFVSAEFGNGFRRSSAAHKIVVAANPLEGISLASMSFWLKMEATTARTDIMQMSDADGDTSIYATITDGGNDKFNLLTQGVSLSSGNFTDNNLHHVILENQASGNLKVFVDLVEKTGAAYGTTTPKIATGLSAGGVDRLIGDAGDDSFTDTYVTDHIEFYDGTLSSEQKQNLFDQFIPDPATLITDVFDTDTRVGRDFKVDVDLADDEDEVTRISIPIEKLA